MMKIMCIYWPAVTIIAIPKSYVIALRENLWVLFFCHLILLPYLLNGLLQLNVRPIIFDKLSLQFSNPFICVSIHPVHKRSWNKAFREPLNESEEKIF